MNVPWKSTNLSDMVTLGGKFLKKRKIIGDKKVSRTTKSKLQPETSIRYSRFVEDNPKLYVSNEELAKLLPIIITILTSDPLEQKNQHGGDNQPLDVSFMWEEHAPEPDEQAAAQAQVAQAQAAPVMEVDPTNPWSVLGVEGVRQELNELIDRKLGEGLREVEGNTKLNHLRHCFCNLQILARCYADVDPNRYDNPSELSIYSFTTQAYGNNREFVLKILLPFIELGQNTLRAWIKVLQGNDRGFYSLERREPGEIKDYSSFSDFASIVRIMYNSFSEGERTENIPAFNSSWACLWRGWSGDFPPEWEEIIESLSDQREIEKDSEGYNDLPEIRPLSCMSFSVDLNISIDAMFSRPNSNGQVNLFMTRNVDPETSSLIAAISNVPNEKEVLINYFSRLKFIKKFTLSTPEDIRRFVSENLSGRTNNRLILPRGRSPISGRVKDIYNQGDIGGDFYTHLNSRLQGVRPGGDAGNVSRIRIIMVDILKSDIEDLPAFVGIGLKEDIIRTWQGQVRGLRAALPLTSNHVVQADIQGKIDNLEAKLDEFGRWRQGGGKINKKKSKRTKRTKRNKIKRKKRGKSINKRKTKKKTRKTRKKN